jgi:hypothetical protein
MNQVRGIDGSAVLVFLLLAVTRCWSAQENPVETKGPAAQPPPAVEDARKYVIESGKDGAILQLNEKSLFNWTNPVRQQERGAIYVWLHDGRPLAIGSLFTYEINGKVHDKHEFHSLATGPLRATFDGTLAWAPQQAGINWHDFEQAPAPANGHVARLLQMRQLSRNFRAELVDLQDQKNQLRLAPRPLFEYSAPKAGIVDGVIFSFVVATDPEVLLLVEAFDEDRDGTRKTGFRYAFARFHYWYVAAFEGDRKVWEVPLDRTHERNPIGNPENIGKVYNSFHPRPSS